jgi:1,4-alpha-glucan branching enzyme
VAAFADGPAVVAFDTELFGHHWHEGLVFLQRVLELADVVPVGIDHAYEGPADPGTTSWGAGNDLRTWSRGELAWTQRRAELAALAAAPTDGALRELLALQSSDWAFLIDAGTAGDYPAERARAHYQSFVSALAGQSSDSVRNLAPQLANWAFIQP